MKRQITFQEHGHAQSSERFLEFVLAMASEVSPIFIKPNFMIK